MNMLERVEDMLDLTARLSELVEDENTALHQRRYGDVEQMLEEKATLARLYENRIKAFEDAKLDWSEVDEGVRDDLKSAGQRLAELMEENALLLQIGMTANRQVLDLFAKAVKQNTPHAGTYSRHGQTGDEGQRASANSLAISLDQTL